jgi:hypothetical protein
MKFTQQLQYLERFGKMLERPHARKLHGYDDLYELRAEDDSGWYRLYYGFGPRRPDGVIPIGLVGASLKHELNPPETDYQRATAALTDWLTTLRRSK